MPSTTQRARALDLIRRQGTLTAQGARRHGIHSQVLSRLVADSVLERVSRGQYRLADAPLPEHGGLALVAGAVPNGVVCLLSALDFHGVGTHLPSAVWIAVPRRGRKPTLEWPPLRAFRFGGESMTTGVETHMVEGVPVKVFCLAKTLADLFKYRNKVGLDVCLEALKEAWRDRRFSVDDLVRYAQVCRVDRVMRPYLEAIIT